MNSEAVAAISLLSAHAVRGRAHRMLAIGIEDRLPHFRIYLAQLAPAADLVAETTRKAYPTLDVPLHARWRHFVIGGRDRWGALEEATSSRGLRTPARPTTSAPTTMQESATLKVGQ